MDKKARRRIGRGACAALFGMLCMVQAAMPAFAKEDVKEDKGSLSVSYHWEEGAVADAHMSLYYVGQGGEEGFAWSDDFAGYRLYGEDMTAMGGVLQGLAQRDAIEPDAEGVTDEDGVVTFEKLDTGYYLVTGEAAEIEDVTLHMYPILVSVTADGIETKAEAKYERTDIGQGDISVTVTKKWDVKEDKETDEAVLTGVKPTKSIQADLMQDGKLLETVTLSEENEWSHTWELPAGHVYQALETAVPEGFEMSVDYEDGDMVIVNHGGYTAVDKEPAKAPEDKKDKTDKDDKKAVTPSDATPKSPTANGGGAATTTVSEKLPQTGMRYWPIVASFGACAVLGTIGGVFYYKSKKK